MLKLHQDKQTNFSEKIYIVWYNGNNSEIKTDNVTAKDRHVINSSPLVDTKYRDILGVFEQLTLGLYTIL